MAEKFSTFVMSETTLNQIKVLPPEEQLKFFWAVANYGVDGIEPEFTGMDLAVWIPMRDLILYSKRKDEKWRLKQKENGKKGGRPKTQNNPEEPKITQNNPSDVWVNVETHNDNNNNNNKDKDKVNLNNKDKDNNGASAPSCDSAELQDSTPTSNQKSEKRKKPPLREREPMNDYECVEKAYLQNWDLLYSQGRVQTENPEVNWNQTRKLLKDIFSRLKPEQIIQAINNGMKNDWIMERGYSLGVMLTKSILNGLINGQKESQISRGLENKISLEGLKDII